MAKLSGVHMTYILAQVAGFNYSPKVIAEALMNPDVADEKGFNVVGYISKQTIWYHIKRLDQSEVTKVREAFLSDFSDLPLAHKKIRIKELSEMYMGLKGGKGKYEPAARVTLMINILNQIKLHGGEDIDKLVDAIARSGSNETNYHINLGERTPVDRDTIRDSVNAAYKFRSRF